MTTGVKSPGSGLWAEGCSFPEAAVTNTEMYPLTVGGCSPKSRCRQGHAPPKAPRRKVPWLFRLLVAPGSLWLVAAPLHPLPPSSRGLLPYVCLVLCVSLTRTLVIGFQAQSGNPG